MKITADVRYYHGDELIVSLNGREKSVNLYSFEVATAGRAAAVAFAMLDLLESAGFLPMTTQIGALDAVRDELEIVTAGHSVKKETAEVRPDPQENGHEAEVPF